MGPCRRRLALVPCVFVAAAAIDVTAATGNLLPAEAADTEKSRSAQQHVVHAKGNKTKKNRGLFVLIIWLFCRDKEITITAVDAKERYQQNV